MKFRFYIIYDDTIVGTDHQAVARRAAEDDELVVIDTDGGKVLQPDTHVTVDIKEQDIFTGA